MIIIVFGVTGAGKTTVCRLLAEQLGWQFYDADQFHPAGNVEKMRQGVPLTDADRRPWLKNLRAAIRGWLERGENAVLACSALKEEYRRYLQIGRDVRFIYLRAKYELIEERLRRRRGHFMHPALLPSQFETLEEPAAGEAVVLDPDKNPQDMVEQIRKELKI